MHKKRRIWNLIWQRAGVGILLILQLWLMIYLMMSGSTNSRIIGILLNVVSFIAALVVVSKDGRDGFKFTWLFLILLFPLFGGVIYCFFSYQSSDAIYRKRLRALDAELPSLWNSDGQAYDMAMEKHPSFGNLLRYLDRTANFPVYSGCDARFLPSGEAFREELMRELRVAEKYIFLEFFIIEEGEFWDGIFDILTEKVKSGVEVRMIYDDVGCIFKLPKRYERKMQAAGLNCRVFNPFLPFLNPLQNNRDHRKIVSIDGKVAFTGGINLADEYINRVDRFGHWCDSAIITHGAAAWGYTVMFLQMWALSDAQHRVRAVAEAFVNDVNAHRTEVTAIGSEGYIQPYSDSPKDQRDIADRVYTQLITQAKRYVYITTPYLIMDETMTNVLCAAAESGVDVEIITPHKWDKWIVHKATRSNYPQLLRSGVRIYEYTPGFIHSKTMVSDDEVATVGTINLDYRSLYLHFECGSVLYGGKTSDSVRDEFLAIRDRSEEITLEAMRDNWFTRLTRGILRLLGTVM